MSYPREPEDDDQYFKVMCCPDCGRTTVVDTRYYDQRCDWMDTCGVLFDIEDADESETTMADL